MRATFISPKLCGCKVSMDAQWLEGDVVNGESYRHPGNVIEYPITGLEIVSVCDEHKSVLKDPIPENPYTDHAGYIKIPENPTEAEKLYIYLFRYQSIRYKFDTCGCWGQRLHNLFDPTESVWHFHPRNSRKCSEHAGLSDEDAIFHAKTDNEVKTQVFRELLNIAPRLFIDKDGGKELSPESEYKWRFEGKDDKRKLIIEIMGNPLTLVEKAELLTKSFAKEVDIT